ncbi:ATP-binding cassette sub-family C member 5-like [Diadema antillarum]|uniref:ATP-binding cassette sub-family C member 5-like n=1 Tax=Diadema antillarum TaxID=105358 RepID=UPI003A840C68
MGDGDEAGGRGDGRTGSKYRKSLKLLIPFRLKPTNEEYSPLDHCGFMSFVWLSWMTPLFYKAYKRTLEYSDLWTMSDLDRGDYNGKRFERLWLKELERKGEKDASMVQVAIRFTLTRTIISMVTLVVSTMATFITAAVIVEKLLEYTESEEVNVWYGIGLVIATFVLNIVRICSDVFYWVFSCRTSTRLRSGVLCLAFRRLAYLRSLKSHSVGEIVNICTNDSHRIFQACLIGYYLISSVVMLVAATVATQLIVGPGALIGTVVTFALFFPLQLLFGQLTSVIRIRCVPVVDQRIQKMNEILTYVKLIKMYAWEKPFARTIGAIRSREKKLLEKSSLIQSYSVSIIPVVPSLASVAAILIHVAMGNSLTASEAFTLVALLNVLRVVVGPTPFVMRMLAEAVVALKRLRGIITLDKVEPNPKLEDTSEYMAEMTNGTFGWDAVTSEKDRADKKKGNNAADHTKQRERSSTDNYERDGVTSDSPLTTPSEGAKMALLPSGTSYDSSKFAPALFEVDFKLKRGKLTGVCGIVGSGKTSLISAILGQMHALEGECRVGGRFAYVAQEAWIFNASVRENILFGLEMDEECYASVISVCCLQQDLNVLSDGDKTEIGERGINLSGGQKQRISLARAVYANQDVYLLDNPLSAVDAHVGQHIFKECIRGVLREKTVLFVTHQLQYLQDCDTVVVMAGGRIVERGGHEELMELYGEYAGLISAHYFQDKEEEEAEEEDETAKEDVAKGQLGRQASLASSAGTDTDTQSTSSHQEDGQLTTLEERTGGALSLQTYHGYIQAMGGYFFAFCLLLSFIVLVGILTFNTWWLGYWIETSGNRNVNEVRTEEPTLLNDPDLGFYMMIYGLSLVVVFIVAAIKSLVYMKLTLKSSNTLHNNMYHKVMRSPMSFFDTTPTGRILNRFSKDMDELDVLLPVNVDIALMNGFIIIASFISITAIFYYFAIVIIPLIIIAYVIFIFYRRGVNDMKQLENVTRSPWFSHIGSTAMGLSTIHAYGKTEEVIAKFIDLLDVNAYPMMLFTMAIRWAGARMELIVLAVITITNLFVVFMHGKVAPALAGLAVSYAMQCTGLFLFTMSMMADAEARFFSAERILQYNNKLVSEAPEEIPEKEPEKSWPAHGAIEFKNYKMRYRDNLPLVLKGINCNIQAGEKIGIVGRTGSGKSSLSVALLRLVEANQGQIIVDGVNIADIGLSDLRSRLFIIPQDPVLFIGSVRYNVDPFNEHTDDKLWEALEKAYMKKKISSLDHGLDSQVAEGGDNFSLGERQLLCMARALLRNSKILFLDEATAAIDTETDSLIQQTIRSAFSDCTTLTIAHRLNTVLDSDKILVMDDGKIAEFDSPAALRNTPNSLFAQMLAAAETQKSNNGLG